MSDKAEIRRTMKIKRKYFGEVKKLFADGCICDNFLARFGESDSFFIYNSTAFEADTAKIISALLKAKRKVYLPRVEGEDIVAVRYRGGKNLKKSAFGIYEPRGQALNEVCAVTLIPLLAVNERGYRIGYGGGYYDKYLKDKNTVKVGLGYAFQMSEFAEEGHDIPLDYFICERGIISFGV